MLTVTQSPQAANTFKFHQMEGVLEIAARASEN